jgi:IclR family transcriptional regulator, acetate operon repressor
MSRGRSSGESPSPLGDGSYDPGVVSAQEGSKLNQSVQKAITLLRATATHPDGASVSALARAAGLPRATALRLIQTLELEGMLVRVPEADRVLLGPELVRLAREVDLGTVVRELATARLGELSEELRETVTLSVAAPDGGLDLAHQVDGPQHLVPRSWVGQRFPLHASSSGKLLLASFDDERLARFLREPLERLAPSTITTPRALRQELDRVREQGCATTIDEMEEGLAGVSVGIFNATGALLGAINISGLSQRLDEAARRRGPSPPSSNPHSGAVRTTQAERQPAVASRGSGGAHAPRRFSSCPCAETR